MTRNNSDVGGSVQFPDWMANWFRDNDPLGRVKWQAFARERVAQWIAGEQGASNQDPEQEEETRKREGLSSLASFCKRMMAIDGLIVVRPSRTGRAVVASKHGACAITTIKLERKGNYNPPDLMGEDVMFFFFERRDKKGKKCWEGWLPVLPKYGEALNELLADKKRDGLV